MLRKLMGGLVALMLVATLLLPAATVGAQDDDIELGPAPVLTEETVPDAESPPVEEVPPIVEPEPAAPVVEQPISDELFVNEPVVEEPVVDESVIDESAIDEPVTNALETDDPASDESDSSQNESIPANAADRENDAVTAASTSVSGLALTCSGLLTFTVDETSGGTLTMWFYTVADEGNQDLDEQIVSDPAPGATQVQFSFESAALSETMGASIVDDNYDLIGTTTASGCTDGEEPDPVSSTIVSNLSVTCAGIVNYTITQAGAGDVMILQIVDPDAPVAHRLLAEDRIDVTTTGAFQFGYAIESRPLIRVSLLDTATAAELAVSETPCDDEPDPDVPVVQDLAVSCIGFVTFDLVASEPVLLDIAIFIPAAAPGYHDERQITATSGQQEVAFDPPVRPFEWVATVSYDDTQLAEAIVQGCPIQAPNTMPGTDVEVPIAGGTVTFENVLEPGETYFNALDPATAPPLPAEYQDDLVIMIDLRTTAQISGAATICLPITGEVAADPENVRLLHYENGAWVDITTDAGNGQVCGVTTSFSPFAIIWLSGDGPVDPGKPTEPGKPVGPDKPGHHGTPGGHANPGTQGGTGSTLAGLPNTGAGAPATHDIMPVAQLLLAGMALVTAFGLRFSSPQKRKVRAR